MMRIILLATFFLSFNCMARRGGQNNELRFENCLNSERRLCSVGIYSDLRISKFLSKAKLTVLLQDAYDKLHNIGFRYIGHDMDFFHGHLLYNDTAQGILYHTQELAALYAKKDENHRYAYLDRKSRNWYQYLDKKMIVNANDFVSEEGKTSDAYKIFREAYTVNQQMIDFDKLTKSSVILKAHQFTFYQIKCTDNENENSNIIQLNVGVETMCLIVN